MIIIDTHNYNWVECISDSYLFIDKDIWFDSKWFFMVLWNHKNNKFSNRKEFLLAIRIWETSCTRILKELEKYRYIKREKSRDDSWLIVWSKIILCPFPDLI